MYQMIARDSLPEVATVLNDLETGGSTITVYFGGFDEMSRKYYVFAKVVAP